MQGSLPNPLRIYRITHIDNLQTLLERQVIHAKNFAPNDNRRYIPIHNKDIGSMRSHKEVPCGPGGVIHDYVQFYLGPRSPMLLQIADHRVEGCAAKQEDIVYLVVHIPDIVDAGLGYVFTDGHALIEVSSLLQ